MKSKIILIGFTCAVLLGAFQQCSMGGSESGSLGQLGSNGPPGSGRTVPETVSWQNIVGLTVTTSSLTKTSAESWTNGATSTQGIPSGNGYIEFTHVETNTFRMGGLSHGDQGPGYTDINFAIHVYTNSDVYIFENGVSMTPGTVGKYSAGDVFRIAVDGDTVRYYKNGALLHTSSTTPRFPLFFDAALYSQNSTIVNPTIYSEAGLRNYTLISGGLNGVGEGTQNHRATTCPSGTTVVGGNCNCSPHATLDQYIDQNNVYYCICAGPVPSGQVAAFAICQQ